MKLYKFLPRFIRLQLLALVEEQLNSLTEADLAKGLAAVKEFILSHVSAFLHL